MMPTSGMHDVEHKYLNLLFSLKGMGLSTGECGRGGGPGDDTRSRCESAWAG